MSATRILPAHNPFTAITILAFLVCSVFGARAQEWPMLNHDMGRTSWARGAAQLKPPLTLDQSLPVGEAGRSNGHLTLVGTHLIVASGTSGNNLVSSIHAAGGAPAWTYAIPESAGSVSCVPATANGMTLVGGQNGEGLFALNTATGVPVWSKPLGSLYGRSPVIDGSLVYIIADSLYCLDLMTGATVWNYRTISTTTPAVDEEHVYAFFGNRIHVVDKNTGQFKYTMSISGRKHISICAEGGKIFCHDSGAVVCRDAEDGRTIWSHPLGDNTITLSDLSEGQLAVSDNYVCFTAWKNVNGNGQVFVLDRADGKRLWDVELAGEGVYAPTIANNVAYMCEYATGDLLGFDLATGNVLLRDTTGVYTQQPIVANDKLYAFNRGRVIVFSTATTSIVPAYTAAVTGFSLVQLYPNPSTGPVYLEARSAPSASISLTIYDMLGRRVHAAETMSSAAGRLAMSWDGLDSQGHRLPAGMYVLHLASVAKPAERLSRVVVLR